MQNYNFRENIYIKSICIIQKFYSIHVWTYQVSISGTESVKLFERGRILIRNFQKGLVITFEINKLQNQTISYYFMSGPDRIFRIIAFEQD